MSQAALCFNKIRDEIASSLRGRQKSTSVFRMEDEFTHGLRGRKKQEGEVET